MTENDVKLNIDPAILYDGDDIWLYWGSWSAGRRVKLKENMIELASKPEDIGIKDFFEAPWMHKFRGNYYFSYASGYPSTTNYSMAPTINGPWTQKGVINAKEDNSETNHQAIFKYMGHWYFMHHGANSPGGWTYRRSVNIDYLYYDRDGNIQKIVRTAGVDKVNNALIKDGAYRLTVSHSNLALQDDGDMVIQQTADETADDQLWVVAAGKTKRHYTLQNYGTKKYYCPQAVLLDTVRTSATPCEIRIENESSSSVIPSEGEESKNCEDSNDENCKTGLRLVGNKPAKSMSYDAAAGMVRLANDSHWTIFSLNGNVVQCGLAAKL